MLRLAALALLLAASPAAAACRTVDEATPAIAAIAGEGAVVRKLPDWIAPAIVEWAPVLKGADGFVTAVTLTGILLFPSTGGQVCDGTAGRVGVEDTPAFLDFIKRWMDARGFSRERSA